jgi:ribosomal protein S8
MQINKLHLLVNLIKINLAKRKLISKVPFSNLNIRVLKILYSEGYIRGFKVINYTIFIYLKLINSFCDICYFPSNNKYSYISYQKLISSYNLKNFLIISTNLVLLTLEQCFLYKCGGRLLILINH